MIPPRLDITEECAEERIFDLMQRTVDHVHTSAHADKVSAMLVSAQEEIILYTNYTPDRIAERAGLSVRFGEASSSVHAETACILHTSQSEGSILLVTDPPCPNCAKNAVFAGVPFIYIDHKGFEKSFAKRREAEFRTLTLPILELAGIGVSIVWRKEGKIIPLIYPDAERYVQTLKKSVTISSGDSAFFASIESVKHRPGQDITPHVFACAVAVKKGEDEGDRYTLFAYIEPVAGAASGHLKYSPFQEPVNGLLTGSARHGFKILPGHIFSSRVPTAREQVNLVAAGFYDIQIGDPTEARDAWALSAMEQMQSRKIMTFRMP